MATLRFSATLPPYGLLAAARLAGVEITAADDANLPKDTPPVLSFADGTELSGAATVVRYLGRAGVAGLYGDGPLQATQVDQWIDFLPALAAGPGFPAACAYIDSYLALRTMLVGNQLSVADLLIWGHLKITPMLAVVIKGGKNPHLARWFDFCSAQPHLAAVAEQYGKKKPAHLEEAAKGKGGKVEVKGSFEIDLKDAKMGEVVTRFPPEPSGYLHIGHAKAALLNQYFAHNYKGKLIVRFDDTNPSKEKDEFEEAIIRDLATLGIKADQITHSSDHFEKLLLMGEKLIKQGDMYIDDTPTEKMREERMVGTESKCRTHTVEENMALWKEMLAGSERGQECAARFKFDMQNKNKALRDPVAFRCNLTPHHITGTRFKCYPTYDCACPYVDAAEGVTHALRTSEYADRDAQFHWVQKIMGVRKVHIWEYSRMNFVNTCLSKRKLQWCVDTGKVTDWNDPRFPTVQGIMRRGMRVEALKEFILLQGASKNVNLMEWDKLWSINKKVIDPVAARHTAVHTDGKVLLTLTNGPATPEVVIILRHKKNPDVGKKATTMTSTIWLDQVDAASISEGEEVTLMDWGNCIVRSIAKDADGKVTGLTGELHLAGSVKTTKLKLTWLPQIEDLTELTLIEYGPLITKKKLEEEDNFEDFVNGDSEHKTPAVGDANMRTIKQGEVIQIERKGYFICDKVYGGPGSPAVFLNIPDGRVKGYIN